MTGSLTSGSGAAPWPKLSLRPFTIHDGRTYVWIMRRRIEGARMARRRQATCILWVQRARACWARANACICHDAVVQAMRAPPRNPAFVSHAHVAMLGRMQAQAQAQEQAQAPWASRVLRGAGRGHDCGYTCTW